MSTDEQAVEPGGSSDHAVAAAGRALVLLLIAVVLGVVVLQAMDDDTANRAQQVKTTTVTEAKKNIVSTTTEPEVAVRAPSEVSVVALNGAGVKGAAGTVTDQLKKVQYNVLAPDNTKKVVKTSAVYFTTGYEEEARAVAKTLGLAPTTVAALPSPPPGDNIRTAKVVVVVGPDLVKK